MSRVTYIDADISDEFKSNIRVFVTDALKHLYKRYKAPKFGQPKYPEQNWRFADNDCELVTKPFPSIWLQMYRQLPCSIIETLDLLESSPFRNLREFIESKPELCSLLGVHRGLHFTVTFDGESSTASLLRELMEYQLVRMVNETRSFEFSDEVFDTTYGEFEEKLLNPFIHRIQYAPLRHFACGELELVELAGGWKIRLSNESEVSEVSGLGVLPIRFMGRRAYLPVHHQFVLTKEEFTEIDISRLADEKYLAKCMSLAEIRYPIDDAAQIVAVLNLVSDEMSVIMGEPWCVVESTFKRIVSRSGEVPVQSPKSWASCTLSDSSAAELAKLWDCIRKLATKHLEMAVLRFYSAAVRLTSEDAIVDLAIAAESLFAGKGQGEASYRISVNAALWLNDTSLTPSDVRNFFQKVYRERSRIVHGTPPSRDEDRPAMRKKLTTLMRHALKKAILHSSENESPEWDQLLNKVLDSRWNKPGIDQSTERNEAT